VKPEPLKERPPPAAPPQPRPRRLTYAEQRELGALPDRITELETQLGELHRLMSDPAFYRQEPAEIVKTNARLQSLQTDLAAAYHRWELLETLAAQGK
jgi:ATP-binding cassette subfamily F protein uup